MQQVISVMRFDRMLSIRGLNLFGALSTRFPRAAADSRTQIVSAMPLMEEGRRSPGNVCWMNRI